MEIDHREKNHLLSNFILLYSYEKKVQSFYYFSIDFFSIFQDLFQVLQVLGLIDKPAMQMATGIKAFTS